MKGDYSYNDIFELLTEAKQQGYYLGPDSPLEEFTIKELEELLKSKDKV